MKPAGHQLVIPDIEDVWEIKPTYNIHMENLKERYHLGYSGRDEDNIKTDLDSEKLVVRITQCGITEGSGTEHSIHS